MLVETADHVPTVTPRKRDPEIALAAVKSDFVAFQHVAPVLKTNRLIALAAVKQSAKIFESLPDVVKSDREAGCLSRLLF